MDYISPVAVSGAGAGAQDKVSYGVGEIVKGARDAEDAVKRFKEDQGRFVRPVVCFSTFFCIGLSLWRGCFD